MFLRNIPFDANLITEIIIENKIHDFETWIL